MSEPTPLIILRSPDPGDAAEAAAPAPLGPAALAAALARLPDWPEPPAENPLHVASAAQPSFAESSPRPPLSASPPRLPVLPPDHPLVAAPVAPPRVVSRAPLGDISEAAQVVIGFSRPMVPLIAHKPPPIPATISPEPPGAWRWLDSQTLAFESPRRFPMASEFEVTVLPCADIDGAPLQDPPSWRFTTSPLVLCMHEPWKRPSRDWYDQQLVVLGFNQRIDPAALLPYLQLTINGEPAALALVDLADPANQRARRAVDRYSSPVKLALRLADPLPARAEALITLLSGAPSAEGPRRTAEDQWARFYGYAPLTLERHHQGDGRFSPLSWSLRFSNPLLAGELPPAPVQIEPALAAKIEWMEWGLTIEPEAAPETAYAITLSPALRDVFGQELGSIEPVVFRTPAAPFLTPARRLIEPAARLYVPKRSFVSLDPSAPPLYTVFSRGLDRLEARLYVVGPEDWGRFNAYQEPLGTCVWRGQIHPDPAAPQAATPIDLSPALRDGRGHCIVEVFATADQLAASGWVSDFAYDRPSAYAAAETSGLTVEQLAWAMARVRVWVQVTALDLSVFLDQQQLVGWASSLLTGEPLAGVELSLRAPSALEPGGWAREIIDPGSGELAPASASAGVSDSQGTALLRWEPGCTLLIASLGGDLAILPVWDRQRPLFGAGRSDQLRRAFWYVIDDRRLYRPGETLAVKGWVRRRGPEDGWTLQAPAGESVAYALIGPRGRPLAHGRLPVSAQGGFELLLELPESIALGRAELRFSLGEERHAHPVRIAEFRRPEFTVTASAAAGPHVHGSLIRADALAQLYTGEPLAGARVGWRVAADPVGWSPPHLSDWTWQPRRSRLFDPKPLLAERAESATNAEGRDGIVIDTAALPPAETIALSVEATISDAGRQSWAGRASALVHPAELYVGLWVDQRGLVAGRPVRVAALVVDLQGRAVAGREIALELALERFPQPNQVIDRVTLVSSAGPVFWELALDVKTHYDISAAVTDQAGRRNCCDTSIRIWREALESAPAPPPGIRRPPELELVPGGPYQPGDMAQIQLTAPLESARGIVRALAPGSLACQSFLLAASRQIIDVPISPDWAPNSHVRVDLIETAIAGRARAAGVRLAETPQPQVVSGTASLKVRPLRQRLSVAVAPRMERLRPGGSSVIDVEVRGADGEPVAGAEVALFVVDQSVLDLAGGAEPHPLSALYPRQELDGSAHHLWTHLFRPDPDEWSRGMGGGKEDKLKGLGGGSAEPTEPPPPHLRHDFNPLALFAPALVTDERGRASAPITLPGTLAGYRVLAVAAEGGRFGRGRSAIVCGLPLMVRPAPPRFARPGDRGALAVTVQNTTGQPLAATVALRARSLSLDGPRGYAVELPPRTSRLLVFRFAAETAGRAEIQFGAWGGEHSDAAQVGWPVLRPATFAAVASYGELDDQPVRELVALPAEALPEIGGLSVSLSASLLPTLAEALRYLADYGYGCAEQRASRVLGLLARAELADAPGSFAGLRGAAQIREDLALLQALQTADGGCGFWPGAPASEPFVSIHALHGLLRASHAGYAIDSARLAAWLAFARRLAAPATDPAPGDSGRDRLLIQAYAVYALRLAGETVDAAAVAAQLTPADFTAEAAGWLLASLVPGDDTARAMLLQAARNALVETAAAARLPERADGYAWQLGNRQRGAAVLLAGLLEADPTDRLAAKLARGLLDDRRAGHWRSTQGDAWALLSLAGYARRFEQPHSARAARIWVNGACLAEGRLSGPDRPALEVEVPLSQLLAGRQPAEVVLEPLGGGRLHSRLLLRCAVAAELPAASHGVAVAREYLWVDAQRDVRPDQRGGWRIRPGALVEVRVFVEFRAGAQHVALVDHLPAGLEALDPDLTAVERLAQRRAESWSHWWDHVNLRDDRVEIFAALLPAAARRSYSYLARATAEGAWSAPGVYAEQMYRPEVFGRSASDRIWIE